MFHLPGGESLLHGMQSTLYKDLDQRIPRSSRTHPNPELLLYGPSTISAGSELTGRLSLNLQHADVNELQEVIVRIEAVVTTWVSSSKLTRKERKKIFQISQRLWRRNYDPDLDRDIHSWDFSFFMPANSLPPSFVLNSHIHIQFKLKGVAVYRKCRKRAAVELIHIPNQGFPEEEWNMASTHCWLLVKQDVKTHDLSQQLKMISSKLSDLNITPSVPHLGLVNKLKRRKFFPVLLESLYLSSGVEAGSEIPRFSASLVFPESPVPQLTLRSVQVYLRAYTEVKVLTREITEVENTLLKMQKLNWKLPAQAHVDISEFISECEIPDVAPSFETKLLKRRYEVVVVCELSPSSDLTMMSRAALPLKLRVLPQTNVDLLPAYDTDRLPEYCA